MEWIGNVNEPSLKFYTNKEFETSPTQKGSVSIVLFSDDTFVEDREWYKVFEEVAERNEGSGI